MTESLASAFNIRHADPQVRSGNVAWWHISSEYVDDVDGIMDTLAPEGPYAYTVANLDAQPGKIPTQRILTTREQIHECYQNLHRFTAVRAMTAIAEIHGDWYAFMCGIGEGLNKLNGESLTTPTIVLFPTMGERGITGELFWTRCRGGDPQTSEADLADTLAVHAAHDRFVAALRSSDVDQLMAMSDQEIQTAVRDFVDDTGTLVELHDATALRAHLETFYATFQVDEIEIVNRYVNDWAVFAELRWRVRRDGVCLTFRTAEIAEIDRDGVMVARIGHGTSIGPDA